MIRKLIPVICSVVLACGEQPREADSLLRVTVRLLDEHSSSIPDGWVDHRGTRIPANERGEVQLALAGPDVVVVAGPDKLEEPAVFGTVDHGKTVPVRLWASNSGARRTVHFGGDVMFARRYLTPTSGEPLITSDEVDRDAALVVQRIAQPFAAADLSIVNLETAVSELGIESAYPGKRFLLNSPPEAMAGLVEMGVDVVGLANNHTRDWLEPGLASTLEALDSIGVLHVGAGLDDVSARAPAITDVNGLRVATLAYTSVNGSFVNDNYPTDAATMPESVADKDVWIWQARPFSCDLPGFRVSPGEYRIGEVWQRFSSAEDAMGESERASAWSTLTSVYPELQDWVARRGHGGAAYYVGTHVKADIAAVKQSADVTVVLLHAGYQFQDVASETVVGMAHTAVDAGADIVVCHHPHVLQGLEFYKDKLVFYSLGNFVFDQDFLSTFSTAFLRTVWDGNQMLEARLVPVEIADYRPVPVTDKAAERIFRRVWESSLSSARSARVGGGVFPVVTEGAVQDRRVDLIREWGTARFVQDSRIAKQTLTAGGSTIALDDRSLVRVSRTQDATFPGSWSFGRELLGWGHFEDVLADGVSAFGQNYVDDHADKAVMSGNAATGAAFLRLHRDAKKKDALYVRPVARIALPRHRSYSISGNEAVPMDSEPSYTIRAMVRGRGDVQARFRIDCFHFDDTNPTEDPSSRLLASVSVPVKQVTDRFQLVEYPIELASTVEDEVPNMVMVYVGLAPPKAGDAEFDIDEIEWIEWRDVSSSSADFGSYQYAKSKGEVAPLDIEVVSMEL